VFLPFYQVMLLLVFFAGFTALEVMPGLAGQVADQSFMLVVQKYYPAWVLGCLAAAGTLAALVPAAGQLLAAASIVGKNVFADYGIARDPVAQTRTTRVLVLVVALLAFGFWAYNRQTLVGLLLIGYNGIAQLVPGVVLGVTSRRPSALPVGAGIVAGLVTLVYFAWPTAQVSGKIVAPPHTTFYTGINTGLIALAINIVVTAVLWAVVPRQAPSAAQISS